MKFFPALPLGPVRKNPEGVGIDCYSPVYLYKPRDTGSVSEAQREDAKVEY